MQKFLAVFVAVLFTLSVIIGVSFAVAQANNVTASNTIHSCVNTHTGVPSIVSAGHKCDSSHYGLSWNKTGPQGPQGNPGVGNNKVEVESRSVTVDANSPLLKSSFELHCSVGNVLAFSGQSGTEDTVHFDSIVQDVSDNDDQFTTFTYESSAKSATLTGFIECLAA